MGYDYIVAIIILVIVLYIVSANYNKLRTYIHNRNRQMAMNTFSEHYGSESEFSERRIMNVTNTTFKIFDPGTDNVMYFSHALLGPIVDDI